MRSLVLALCAAFAVLLTAVPAHAQAPRRWCAGAFASYRHLDRDHATSFVRADAPVVAPATPLRSQAPTLCDDPRQAGCRIDRPDAPRHHTSWDVHHEPVALTSAVPEVQPRPADDVTTEPLLRDGPRVATTRAPLGFGPANAPVVIQHFADYQCPFSSRVGPTIERIRQRYGDRVRFVWRDYPLPFHPAAVLAAEAAREAYAQRGNAGSWRFHDHLFGNQAHVERADLERYATEQGLDVDRFRSALDRHIHKPRIKEDMAAADATGAQIGTPAFFIAGRFVAGALPFEEFERRIDAALGRRPP